MEYTWNIFGLIKIIFKFIFIYIYIYIYIYLQDEIADYIQKLKPGFP